MSKERKPDNNDKLFRDLLRQGNGSNDWDKPSPGMWNRISDRLDERKRRPAAFWIGPLLLVLAAFLAGWLILNQDSTPDKNQKSTPQAETYINSTDHSTEPEFQSQSAGQHRTPELAEGLDIQDVKGEDSRETSLANSGEIELGSENAGSRQFRSAEEKPDYVYDFGEAKSDVTSGVAGRAVPGNVQIPDLPTALSNPTERIETEGSSRRQVIGGSRQSAVGSPGRNAFEEIEPLSTQRYPLSILVRPDPVPSPVFPEKTGHLHSIRQDAHAKMTFQAFSGINMSTPHLKVNSHQPSVLMQILQEQEQAKAGFQWGITVDYRLNRRFFLATGVTFKEEVTGLNQFRQIRFTRNGETDAGNGRLRNHYTTDFTTSYGRLNAEIILERSSSQNIPENSFIRLHLNATQNIQSVRVPVLGGLLLGKGKLTTQLTAGVALDHLFSHDLHLRGIVTDNAGIDQLRLDKNIKLQGHRVNSFEGLLSAGLNYHLNNRLSLAVNADLAYGITPVYTTPEISVHPIEWGFRAGLKYHIIK